jgi:putative colanic acid biosynthesis acetyltransferase WcaF
MPWNLEIGDWSSIGENALVYNLGMVTVGENVTVSQRAHLCAGTHDYQGQAFELIKAPIHIGTQAWICADAFVGPGVVVGEGAVVGARAVVMSKVGDWDIVAGNPAKFLKKREMGQQPPVKR